MICVPVVLEKHGGFFFPSIRGLHQGAPWFCRSLWPTHPAEVWAERANARRRGTGTVPDLEGMRQGDSGSTPTAWPSSRDEWYFFHMGITLLKPNFLCGLFHRLVCAMMGSSGWHKVWICSTLSSLPANLQLLSVLTGIVDMHNFTCSSTAEFSIQIPTLQLSCALKDEKLCSCQFNPCKLHRNLSLGEN